MAKESSKTVDLAGERFVPIREAFQTIGVSPSKGYLLARDGHLPIRKVGRRSGVLYSDLVRFLRNLPVKTGSSERHREQALRRWAAQRTQGQEATL